jgi:hypothetical protein
MQISRKLSTSFLHEQSRSSIEQEYKETNDFGEIFLNSFSTVLQAANHTTVH